MTRPAGSPDPSPDDVELHATEMRESQRAERRLLVWEIATLLLVVAFVVVRQRWLV